IAHLWNQGSVVRSWLLELAEDAFAKDPELAQIAGYVEDSGEGRWTVQHAIDSGVSVPVLPTALLQRFVSPQKDPSAFRRCAALRSEVGGDAVQAAGKTSGGAAAGAGRTQPATAATGAKAR